MRDKIYKALIPLIKEDIDARFLKAAIKLEFHKDGITPYLGAPLWQNPTMKWTTAV